MSGGIPANMSMHSDGATERVVQFFCHEAGFVISVVYFVHTRKSEKFHNR